MGSYFTTKAFLEAFGLGSLRDLPDLERLKAEGVLQGGQGEDELDGALGLAGQGDEDRDVLERESEEFDAGRGFVNVCLRDSQFARVSTWTCPRPNGSRADALVEPGSFSDCILLRSPYDRAHSQAGWRGLRLIAG